MKRVIIVCLLIFSFSQFYGQEVEQPSENMVKVYLKNGSEISGTLESWTYGEEVVIMSKGIRLEFPDDMVRKVVEIEGNTKVRTTVNHKNEGLYYTAKAQFLTGNEGGRAHHRTGYGVTASVGLQWNQYLAFGLGTGYRQFIWDSGEKMIPVFAEVKGFLGNRAVRPFYNLELGYSFGLRDEDLGLIKAQGGMSIYPSMGLSFGRKELKYSLDIGYLFQNAKLTYGNDFDDRIRSEHDIRYQRLTMRFGVSF